MDIKNISSLLRKKGIYSKVLKGGRVYVKAALPPPPNFEDILNPTLEDTGLENEEREVEFIPDQYNERPLNIKEHEKQMDENVEESWEGMKDRKKERDDIKKDELEEVEKVVEEVWPSKDQKKSSKWDSYLK